MENKVAFITGAGSGLGSGIARTLCAEGYDIALHTGSNTQRANKLKDELIAETGRRVEVFTADFTQYGAAADLFKQFNEAFDRLDIFVANAGVSEFGRLMEMPEELYDRIHNINFKSAYFCVREAALSMKKFEIAGSIVLISSNQHLNIGPGNSAYSLSKESMIKLTKHAAVEFARYKIRVNCIAPGFVNTGEERMEPMKGRFEKTIPMQRWVEPEEIARWILFMHSNDALSLTGDTIELDGGARLLSGDPYNYYKERGEK